MALLRRLAGMLHWLLNRKASEKELDDEVQAFYLTVADRHVAQGIPASEAHRRARVRFGNPEQAKEDVRDARSGAALVSALRDVKYAVRALRKAPLLTSIAIVMLGVGIGANAAIFSIVNRFVFRHPPVGEPSTLMALHTTQGRGDCCNNFSWPLYNDVKTQARAFSGVAAYYDLLPASIGGSGDPERVWGEAVTVNFFDVARVPMIAGPGFTPEQEHRAAVVLGYSLWQRRFGGDPAIAGKLIRLSGRLYTVAGVAPPGFRGLDIILDAQFWVPLNNIEQLLPNTANFVSRDYHWLSVAGRLAPGASASQGEAELRLIGSRLKGMNTGFRMETAGSLPPRDRSAAMIFFACLTAVALLLLSIACLNVANISLAQAATRRREMAVRLALGATRGHLLRRMLTESLLVSLAGGLLGILLSLWATRELTVFRLAAPVPLDLSIGTDNVVLLYTFLLSLFAGLVFGLGPAWTVARPVIASALKGEDVLAPPGRMWSMRNVLVVAQISMSLVLLCATGLFLRSFQNASHADPGFRSKGILMMSVDPRLHGYTPAREVELLSRIRERALTLPGVISAACTDSAPLSGGHRSESAAVEGLTPPQDMVVELYMASAGYFDTMGIPFIAGRDFGGETQSSAKTAIVNELFARRFLGGRSPVGERVHIGSGVYRIAGVVKNTKSRTVGEEPRAVLYRSLAQEIAADPSMTGYTVLVHTASDPAALTGALREQIRALDPSLAVFNTSTMEEHLRQALFLPRLAGTLFGIFGALGLLLAAVGLYGVVSYQVSLRTREIGVRLAIGARSGAVQRLILRQGMALAVIALVPGLAAAAALGKLCASFLYGVSAHDPATFALVPVFLLAVTFLACWLGSRRASKVDPNVALRHQ